MQEVLDKTINEWNTNHRVGTEIRYWRSSEKRGPGLISKTRSEATILNEHLPVIFIEGVVHAIPLTQVAISNMFRKRKVL